MEILFVGQIGPPTEPGDGLREAQVGDREDRHLAQLFRPQALFESAAGVAVHRAFGAAVDGQRQLGQPARARLQRARLGAGLAQRLIGLDHRAMLLLEGVDGGIAHDVLLLSAVTA